jgi:hypothetical protein
MSEELTQEAPPVNIAAMMAKEGFKTDDSPVNILVQDTTPIEAAPPGEPPKAAEPVVAETATTTPPPEAPRPPEPPKEAPAPQPVQPEPDWRELLKKQPEAEIYKAVGLDEKMINFLSRWKGGEDLKDYYEAITTDYSKMSSEEVLRRHLFKEFGSLPAEDFEEVYKMKVIEQYKLDPDVFDEKEVRRGKLLLGIDADRIRLDLMKKQQDLLLSKPPEPGPSMADLEAQAQQEQREKDIQTYKGLVEGNSYTKELLSNNLLKIGDGDKAFNLEVTNPTEVLDLLYDPGKWSQKLWNADGSPNIHKQLILGAIANDDTTFFTNLAKHYEMLGASKMAEKIQNPSEPPIGTPAKGSAEPNDPISQLARFGVITSGD